MAPLILLLFSTLLFPIVSVSSILDPADFLALQSIRAALYDLPGSAFFSTWDFTSDPCSTFAGVTCSASRVVSLSLGDPRAGSPGLSGHLPSSFSRLSALRSLSLLPGKVIGPIPPSLPHLPNLRFLALSHNYLSGPIPDFSPSRQIQTLDLSFNLLSGPIPTSLPSSLLSLLLSHNHLTGPIPRPLPPHLLRLDLHQNNLSGPLPPLPQSLSFLSLKSNRLSGNIGSGVLPRPIKIEFLDLSMNRFSGEVPGRVFGVEGARVYLQRNVFSGEVRTEGVAVRAREVDLSYNRLRGRVPEGLAEAERVYLNANLFVGRVPRRFTERVRSGGLEVLYLQRNYLVGMEEWMGELPERVTVCLQFNCMVPPAGMVCPVRAGKWRRRPVRECRRWE